MTSKTTFFLSISSLLCLKTVSFSPRIPICPVASIVPSRLGASNNNKNKIDDDLFDDLFNDSTNADNGKLGIDIGKMLQPLTPEEAASLSAEASELIADRVAQGVDDIEVLRAKLREDLEQQSKERLAKSERAAEQASQRLLSKIDRITNDFLEDSQVMRTSTKQAAAADRNMKGKSVELGSWGTLGGVSVGMLGSVGSSVMETSSQSGTDVEDVKATVAPKENRILIIADPSQDPVAKTLVPAFSDLISKAIDGVTVNVIKPTQTMPLGGENAACIMCFATSLTDGTALRKIMDRLLRRTLSNGIMGSPPTQLVCISTLGTERTNKMPYSMQNLLGGTLDKRRQVEEAVINTVQQRAVEPPLDYTILKVGDLKSASSDSFQLLPGDTLDGSTSPDLAVNAMVQAVAFQPFARNATFGIVGGMPSDTVSDQQWDEAFLKLDGPELERFTTGLGDVSYFDQLNEYLGEWAIMMESGKKQLATPVRVAPSMRQSNLVREGVKDRTGVRLLFLPTNTGSAYMSKAEERAREQESGGGGVKGNAPPSNRRTKPEGGVEVLVEVTDQDSLRVRARRCNMADDTVLKEISEGTILKRLAECVDVWKKDVVS